MKLQDEVSAKSIKKARARNPKYVVVHCKEVGNKSQGCDVLGSLEPFPGQYVQEMVGIGTKDAEARETVQGTKKSDLDGLY